MADQSLAGTVHTEAYAQLLKSLVEARYEAGQSQAQLAKKLGKPASFVGKYELGERRLDVIEFLVILKALDRKSDDLIGVLERMLPERL